MAVETPNKVLLHGRDDDTRFGEANAAITPGELIERTGTNASGADSNGLFQPHSSVPSTDTDGSSISRFAVDYSGTGRDLDQDYQDGDDMEYRVGLTGDEIYAFLDAGESVTEDQSLESAGNGALQAHTGADDADTTATQTYYDGAIVGYATEAVDNSGGTGPVRLKIVVD